MSDDIDTAVGLAEALKPLGAAFDDVDEHLAKLADECPYELKLAVTAWVFKKIVEHGKEPGSFRYLIYDRMGFDMDAYVPLYLAGGMDISNEFDMEQMETIKEYIREHKIDGMKHLVGMCDEPGCFRDASSGWPSDKGYRHTCHDHYIRYKKDD